MYACFSAMKDKKNHREQNTEIYDVQLAVEEFGSEFTVTKIVEITGIGINVVRRTLQHMSCVRPVRENGRCVGQSRTNHGSACTECHFNKDGFNSGCALINEDIRDLLK